MISPINGEVSFQDGLCIGAHARVEALLGAVVSERELPVPGWGRHILGVHPSEHGDFDTEVVVSDERRVEALFLSHHHSFYEEGTPQDGERRVYHEGVIALDLRGQREFSWGHVFCRLNPLIKRDWLVIVYNPFANVPLHAESVEKMLAEYEPIPSEEE